MTDKEFKPVEDENVDHKEKQETGDNNTEQLNHHEVVHVDTESEQVDSYKEEEHEVDKSTSSKRGSRGWMIASIVLLAALIYALIQPPFNNNNESESVATVNGVTISKDKLFDEMIKTGGASLLDNIIIEELLNQEAKETGVEVTQEDVDAEILMFKKGYPTDEEWDAVLSQTGTTEEQLRLDVVMNIQIRKLLESQTPVTEDEVTAFYNENLEAMTLDGVVPTLEEKEDEIRYQLVYQKVSEVAPSYIEELRANATIENTLQ